MRHLFVVDSLDKQIQNEKELIHLASAGGEGAILYLCVESINLTWLDFGFPPPKQPWTARRANR